MTEIIRTPEMRLDQDLDARIGILLDTCFRSEFGGRSFYQNRHHVRFHVEEPAGTVIAHLALCLRAARVGAELTTVAGLAEVAVDPAHRGKGLATALVSSAVEEARLSPAQMVMLFGVEPLYERAGFRKAVNPVIHVRMDGARTGEVVTERRNSLRILPLTGGLPDESVTIDLCGFAF